MKSLWNFLKGLWARDTQLVDLAYLNMLKHFEGNIMATLADVTAVVNQLASDVDASQVNITMAVQGLNAQILALQSQLASGAAVTPAELDVLVSAVQAIDAKVKTLVA